MPSSAVLEEITIVIVFMLGCSRQQPSPAPVAAEASSDAAPIPSIGIAPDPAPPAGIPAELVCTSDADCVAIPSACCATRASNALHVAEVRKQVAASDAARDCKSRVCAKQITHAACEQGRCVVW